jgi:hypothetical protein
VADPSSGQPWHSPPVPTANCAGFLIPGPRRFREAASWPNDAARKSRPAKCGGAGNPPGGKGDRLACAGTAPGARVPHFARSPTLGGAARSTTGGNSIPESQPTVKNRSENGKSASRNGPNVGRGDVVCEKPHRDAWLNSRSSHDLRHYNRYKMTPPAPKRVISGGETGDSLNPFKKNTDAPLSSL